MGTVPATPEAPRLITDFPPLKADSLIGRLYGPAIPLANWREEFLGRDPRANSPIGDLLQDYERYCRGEKIQPLPRKAWLQLMKLFGFRTESGVFSGIRLKG